MNYFNLLKNISLCAFIAVLFSLEVNAASPRIAVVEEVTSNCSEEAALVNPQLAAMWRKEAGNVVPIVYHAWYPSLENEIMYQMNTDMHRGRIEFYGTPQLPTLFLNGDQDSYPLDIEAQRNEIHAINQQSSPITIDIEEIKNGREVYVKVTVSSDEIIENKKLRIVACENYHCHEHHGLTGEIHHYFIAREMLPDHNGIALNLEAGESKDFEYNYTVHEEASPGQMFVAAFVQDDDTKEVIQGASNYNLHEVKIEVADRFLKIDNKSSASSDVIITNETANEVSLRLTHKKVNTALSYDYFTFNDSLFTIPANSSKTVRLTFTRDSDIKWGLVHIGIIAIPDRKETGVFNPTYDQVFALAGETKYAIYGGASLGFTHYCYDMGVSLLGDEIYDHSAIIDLSNDLALLEGYPPKDFDLSYLGVDYTYRGNLSARDVIPKAINEALDAGKKVFLTGEAELSLAFSENGVQEAQTLFRDKIGLASGQGFYARVQVNNGQITGVNTFNVNGIDDDPIGNNIHFEVNDYNYSHWMDPYVVVTDQLTPTKEGTEVFAYYDFNPERGAGVRAEIGDARIVYCSFGMGAMEDMDKRKEFMGKIFDWLLGKTTEIKTDTRISFGLTEIGESVEEALEIRNNIPDNVTIRKIELSDDMSGVFKIAYCPALPKTLEESETTSIMLEFNPKEEISYESKLLITTDLKTYEIPVRGFGAEPEGVEDDNNEVFLSACPNPVINNSTFYNMLGSHVKGNIEITLRDIFGNKVKEIYSGIYNSQEPGIEFSRENIPSGRYFIHVNFSGRHEVLPIVIL